VTVAALVCDPALTADPGRLRLLIEQAAGLWSNLSFARFGFHALEFQRRDAGAGVATWNGRFRQDFEPVRRERTPHFPLSLFIPIDWKCESA
jgi:hypothetical protein